jgi:RNA 2',3'-cyclic 3'-phosphodiesterase
MRLFAGVPIPDPARGEILNLLTDLRRSDWPVRWVHDEGLHLTLKFFGEVGGERLDVITEALLFAATGAGPQALTLGELGAFPSRSRPRVLWIGVQAPPSLELLQDRIERGSEAIGFPPEGTPFQPHVTLGRVREGQRFPSHGLDDHSGRCQPLPFVAEELVLYESVLTTSGPRYEPRLTLNLRP